MSSSKPCRNKKGTAPVTIQRRLLIWLSVLLPLGCATGGLTTLAGDIFVPPDKEIELGAQFAAEIPKQYKIVSSGPVYDYVNAIGNRIAEAAKEDRSDVDYRFSAIDDPKTVNAFAVPGGYVYVYTGLLLLAENEAEAAGVVAHEAAHIVRRHSANQLGTRIGMGAITSVALGEDPGLAASIVAGLATTASMLKFSRDDEREADAYGMKYLIAAGYDPAAMVNFFERLAGENPNESRIASYLSTHPLTSERIANLRAERARYGNPRGDLNEAEHEKIKALIPR
jgi:predicted Zn-dependent protease